MSQQHAGHQKLVHDCEMKSERKAVCPIPSRVLFERVTRSSSPHTHPLNVTSRQRPCFIGLHAHRYHTWPDCPLNHKLPSLESLTLDQHVIVCVRASRQCYRECCAKGAVQPLPHPGHLAFSLFHSHWPVESVFLSGLLVVPGYSIPVRHLRI